VASGSDALFDAAISAATLVAAAVSLIWGLSIEGWLGAVIAVVIVKSGVEILLESLSGIIGQRIDSDLSARLKEYVGSFDGVRGAYDLALHHYGTEKIIGSVHVELPDEMTARQIHHLTRRISEGVYREFGIILTVGIYASNTGTDESSLMRQAAQEIAAAYPAFRQLHAFYVEREEKRVSFDLVLDFGCDAAGIRDAVLAELRRRYPDYTFSAVLDTYFSD
jgi:divalent metal cation (Fe/Co/Zn/Cd) transporter